ncbi:MULTISPECIES: hypothetical protein [Xanthomonas]|uniref:hypothetical protein n=1 Tax=Xanthomonas TaxID=338 RepID=UPI00118C094D|nr:MULTISPECIES: hypothetical protein [Xanthomonas]QDS20772.1 hypothetical protein FPL05_14420 [Xanthomonas citri pv. glycines]
MSLEFKTVMIYGDLSSDSASEQYPEVTACADCIEKDSKRAEDQEIVQITGDYDSSYGEECHFCDTSAEPDQ